MTSAGSHREEAELRSGLVKPPRHTDTERDKNGRPKPESHVGSVTSTSGLPVTIPKKPVDSKPHTVEGGALPMVLSKETSNEKRVRNGQTKPSCLVKSTT